MVVIASGGEEGGAVAQSLGHVQAQHARVKGQRAFQVGDFQVDVSDVDARVGGVVCVVLRAGFR